MELFLNIISFLLLIGLLLIPVIIIRKLNKKNVRYKFIIYFIGSIVVTTLIAIAFGWWSYTSNKMLLTHYGYDFDYMNDTEKYENVSLENIDRVKTLEISVMGIGWPLKVMIMYPYYIPYLLIVYSVSYFLRWLRSKNS